MEYLFIFPLVKNGENRSNNARVIVENKVALFSGHGVYPLSARVYKLEFHYTDVSKTLSPRC